MQILRSVIEFFTGVLFFVGFLFVLYLLVPLWNGIVAGAFLLIPWGYYSLKIAVKISEKLVEEKIE